MFYQDILSGKFDRHIPEGIDMHFANTSKLLDRLGKKNPEYAYIFETLLGDDLEGRKAFIAENGYRYAKDADV